jgi:hypothetical protein
MESDQTEAKSEGRKVVLMTFSSTPVGAPRLWEGWIFFYWGNHGKVQSPSKMVIEVRANRIKQENGDVNDSNVDLTTKHADYSRSKDGFREKNGFM